MANNEVTHENVCQNVAVLKNQFQNFNTKMDNIGFKVNHIYENMPEVVRKVNKHHEVFAANQIKIAKIEPIKADVDKLKRRNQKNENGERGQRKYDQKKYKILLWTAIISGLGTILGLIGWLGTMLIKFGEALEQLPK